MKKLKIVLIILILLLIAGLLFFLLIMKTTEDKGRDIEDLRKVCEATSGTWTERGIENFEKLRFSCSLRRVLMRFPSEKWVIQNPL